MIQTIQQYLQFPFVRYALAVGTLIALCSSLLGVTLVLKRFSFIGDGLSHVAFGAMAVAGVLHITNDMLFVMPVTVLCAVLLLRGGRGARVKLPAAEPVLRLIQSLRRRVRLAVRLHLHPHAHPSGGLALRGAVRGSGGAVHLLLQQDLRRHL